MNYHRLPMLCALLFLSPLLYADQPDSIYNLDLAELRDIQLVVAASGFAQKASQAPATVTVITHQQWQAIGARTLSEVLATVPGVYVGKPQVNFKHKKWVFRGLSGGSSSQIKLLIDGEPFENSQDGGLFLGFRIPLNHFERIEVIKGPGSAIYGADAFGGIVNLVSFEQGKIPARVGGRTGSFNSHEFFGRSDFAIADNHFQLSFDYHRSDDDNQRIVSSDLQSTFDGIFGTSASEAPGPIDEHYEVFTLLTKWQWQDLSVDYFTWRNFDLGLAGGVGQSLDSTGFASVHFDQYKISYDFSSLVDGDLTATLNHKRLDSLTTLTVFPAGTVLPIGADGNVDFANPVGFPLFEQGFIGTPTSNNDSTALRLTHLFHATEQHFVRWALGYETLDFNPSERKNFGPGILNGSETLVSGQLTDVTGSEFIYLPNTDRDFYYLSLQDEWQASPDMRLTLGIRYDDYSDFGSSTNPRLGLVYQASNDITLKLFAGSAFKSPPIDQLYSQNNPVGLGNSNLSPETVDTLEAGISVEHFLDLDAVLSMNLFDYHARDLIHFVFQPQRRGNVAQNIGEQKGQGTELNIKYKPQRNMTVDISYSYLSVEDQLGQAIADVPKHQFYLGLNWQPSDNWQWNIDARRVADQKRSASDLRPPLTDYTLINSKLTRHDIIPGLTAAIAIRNLFDKKVKDASNGSIADDYPQPGRQLMVELSYGF